MEDKIAQKEKHYNIQNLRPPWKKGESGNPAGRPKSRVLEALKTKNKKRVRLLKAGTETNVHFS